MNKKSILGVAAVLISAFMLNAEEKVTFTVDGATPVTKTFSVSVENMHLKFRNESIPLKFTAGFKTSSGWYLWAKKKNAEKFTWIAVDSNFAANADLNKTSENVKASLNNAYSHLCGSAGQNVTTDYDFFTNAGYFKGNSITDVELLIDTQTYKDAYNDLYVYDKKEGEFVIAFSTSNNSSISEFIRFKNEGSIEFLKAKYGFTNNQYVWNATEKWLTSENYSTDGKELLYKRICQMIYDSLMDENYIENLYEPENENEYFAVQYLNLCFKKGVNPYSGKSNSGWKSNPVNYSAYSGEEIKAMTDKALDYVASTYKYRKHLSFFKDTPMPYLEYGVDDRAIYNQKINAGFFSGKANGNNPGSGCDSWGMLSCLLDYKRTEYNNIMNNLLLNKTWKKNKITFDKNFYKLYRRTHEDFSEWNIYTLLVPAISDIAEGDIIEFQNKTSKEWNAAYVYSVESDSDETTLSEVKVVYVNPEKGFAENILLEELLKDVNSDNKFIARRLMKQKDAITYSKYELPCWDIFNNKVVSHTIEIEKMREQCQKSSEKCRYIPNTGEYLNLYSFKAKLYNKLGVQLKNSSAKIKFCGAYDRNFGTEVGTNRANNFQFVLLDTSCNPIDGTCGTLNRENTTTNFYKINPEKDYTLTIERNGQVKYNNRNFAIGIRPENAATAYPGDDLLLAFEVDDGNNTEIFTVEDNSYISVYDKKMLWRANLYYEEKESELSNLDWNTAHPWNVPGEENDGQADNPYWNSSDWSFNEWNYSYECTEEGVFEKIRGNGNQTVRIPSWNTNRPDLTDTIAGRKLKTDPVKNRVAYDYPYAATGSQKAINAWDTPFNFIYKMNKQKKAMRENFQAKIDAASEDKLQETKNQTENLFPDGNGGNISGNKETVLTLSTWNPTTAPNDFWKYYWKEPVTVNNLTCNAFVPGIGLYLHAPQNAYNISFNTRLSAGVDCLGYATQAASYSGNIYKWADKPKSLSDFEINESDIEIDRMKSNNLSYPAEGSTSTVITSKAILGKVDGKNKDAGYFTANYDDDLGPTKTKFQDLQKEFLKIVPGDVIHYGNSHIGIIASVDSEGIRNAKSIYGMLECLKVTESFYGSYMNYVFKRASTDGVSFTNDDDITFNKGSWLYDWKDERVMRDFSIERLKTE